MSAIAIAVLELQALDSPRLGQEVAEVNAGFVISTLNQKGSGVGSRLRPALLLNFPHLVSACGYVDQSVVAGRIGNGSRFALLKDAIWVDTV